MTRTSDINSMLSVPDKRIKEARGLLSRLWRLCLMELSVTPYRWNFLLGLYLDKISEERDVTHSEITNERNNLRKGLNEPDMTFPMFLRGIEVLNPRDALFKTTLKYLDAEGQEATVSVSVPLFGDPEDLPPGIGKLTYLFRKLLDLMGKTMDNLNPEIDAYLSNELVRQTTQGRKRGNDKGNLRRELPGDNITWEVYMKGLRVLYPTETELAVILTWSKRRTTTHRLTIRTPKVAG